MRLVGTGAMVQHLMKERGLTVRTLAEQAKTSKHTIYRLINEQTTRCQGDLGVRIERALNVPPGSLFRAPKVSRESHTNMRQQAA